MASAQQVSRVLLSSFCRARINAANGARQYHHPQVPFIGLHDSNKFFMVSKNGFFPLEYFKPEIRRVDIVTLWKRSEVALQDIIIITKRFIAYKGRVDFILFSSGTTQAVRAGGFRNYVTMSDILLTEIANMTEKLKKTAVEVGEKVSKISNDSQLGQLMEKWKIIKEKLPGWQKAIAAKLQSMQDSLNKKLN